MTTMTTKPARAPRAIDTGDAGTLPPEVFVANLRDYNLKDNMASMEDSLFSFPTKPDNDILKWISPNTKKWLEVTNLRCGTHDRAEDNWEG